METEYFKLVYEIGYAKILNFKDIYKEIINPYFMYPNAKYGISNEGHYSESIKMTFPDSNHYLTFSYERISFYYDGSFKDLMKDGSHISMCFDIFNKLKDASNFLKSPSLERLELIAFKELDKENKKIINNFLDKHNIKSTLKVTNDVAVMLRGSDKDSNVRIQCGLFHPETDIESFDIFALSDMNRLANMQNKKGIMIQCFVNKNSNLVSKKNLQKYYSKGKTIHRRNLEKL